MPDDPTPDLPSPAPPSPLDAPPDAVLTYAPIQPGAPTPAPPQQQQQTREQQDDSDDALEYREPPVEKNPTFWKQFAALTIKSWHYQRRQGCEIFWSLFIPPLMIVLVAVLGKAFAPKTSASTPAEQSPLGAFAPLPFPPDLCTQNYYAATSGLCYQDPVQPYPATVFPTGVQGADVGRATYARCEVQEPDGVQTCQEIAANQSANVKIGLMGGYSLHPYMYPPAVNGSFQQTQTSYDGMMLYGVFDGNAANPLYQALLAAESSTPPFTDNMYGTDTLEAVASWDDLKNTLYDGFRTQSVFPPYWGAQMFQSVQGTPGGSDPVVVQAVIYYNQSQKTDCTEGWCMLASGVARVSAAVADYFSNGSVTLQNYLRIYPKTPYEANVNFIGLVTAILIGIVFHFLMPGFMRALVYEKSTRLRVMMEMMGLSQSTYWIVMYCVMLAKYGLMAIAVTLIGGFARVDFFVKNTPVAYIVLFFLWGNTMIAFSVFLAPFFRHPETALVLGWFYVAVVNLVGGPYIGQLYTSNASESLLNAVSILPSFAFFRGIYYMGAFNSGGKGVTLHDEYYGQGNIGLGMCQGDAPLCTVYIFLGVQWFVLLVLGLYFDQVIPAGDTGITKHPLFFLGFKKDGNGRCQKKGACYGKRRVNDIEQELPEDGEHSVPADVAAETENAHSREVYDTGICIQDLVKLYPGDPPKLAVNKLNLCIKEGEVFGMLGHNGAGKTTTINILTGVMNPTDGEAFLDGLNIRTDMKVIYTRMGVCPQFDIQWGDLTASEHLYFYARLKGVARKDLKRVVQKSLESVNLVAAANKQSKTYSGGMKRRLSVAMCLIGDPRIVFLDEPTTGLDPKSKHSLWKSIQACKEGKTIILTTHSMEEAERLCNRVGIMAHGRLQCVGNPEELKLRLGRGYRLMVHLPESNTEALHRAVLAEVSGEAAVESSLAGSVVYSLPRSVVLSKVFECLEKNREEMGIIDWGLSQSTLEDIFIDLTKRAA